MTSVAKGSCLCGAVRFSINGPRRDVLVCHCLFCQRSYSSVAAFSACDPADLEITRGKPKWYVSSVEASRGFCATCGSALFWKPVHGKHISVSAGALDQPTGLRVLQHIHVAQKPDYVAEAPLLPDAPD